MLSTIITIIHVILSVILVAVVLLQSGKSAGLSGSIAGGAETFFGKNKGRTIDAVLKKVTAVVAILFVISSLGLAAYSVNKNKAETEALNQQVESQVEVSGDAEAEAPVEGEAAAEAEGSAE